MREVDQILRKLADQGFEVKRTHSNHYRIYAPDGKYVASTSCTPSDWRVWRNLLSELRRRGGFIWPPPEDK